MSVRFVAPNYPRAPAPIRSGDRRYFEDILVVDGRSSGANPSAVMGSVTTTTDGDFAGATHGQALRSRVIRMVSNPPNAYAHLRAWGLRAKRGQLARPSDLSIAQIQAKRQLLEDPDIADAAVSITGIPGAIGAFLYDVEIADRFGGKDRFQTRVEF